MDVPTITVEELLSDESFLAWYCKTDARAIENWNNRIAVDPAQKKLADEAVLLLDMIRLKEQTIDAHRLQLAEQKLRQNLADRSNKGIAAKRISVRSPVLWWAAAAVLVLSFVAIWQYNLRSAKVAIQTAYGETRKEILPDGSVVMLNAHTSLDYKKAAPGADREVWMNGEAFFQVQKTTQKTRFIVHTGHFDVVVTGTQFNVVSRQDKNNVLLKEGSVIIRGRDREIAMQPGDYVEYSSEGFKKKIVNHAPVLAWTDRKFIFENTPMKEVAASITELYGVKVILENEATANAPISGILPNDNLDVLLQSLQALPDFEVLQSTNEIRIRKN